jgi:hypothetical protein
VNQGKKNKKISEKKWFFAVFGGTPPAIGFAFLCSAIIAPAGIMIY